MAIDMYLKLDKVEGESIDAGHAKEIDLLSANFGATQTGTSHTGGGSGGGKVSMQDLVITKKVDKSSPILFWFCCNGQHVESGVLTVRKAGGKSPLEYMKVYLSNIIVTGYQQTGAEGQEELTEQVTLNFRKVKVEYAPQVEGGSGGAKIAKGWDIAANKDWAT
jgi:type VI secretion system secreted protein Hcp